MSDVILTRKKDEGFGFVIISSITKAGSVVGMVAVTQFLFRLHKFESIPISLLKPLEDDMFLKLCNGSMFNRFIF